MDFRLRGNGVGASGDEPLKPVPVACALCCAVTVPYQLYSALK